MDKLAISAALAVIMAASPEDQPKLLAELKNQIDTADGNGDPIPPSNGEPPMGQESGDPEKKDMPPDMMRKMDEEYKGMRAMGADVRKLRNELQLAADIMRPAAKTELVRTMRAEGVNVTPHAEKLILEAPTLEAARERAAGVRAMSTGVSHGQHRQSAGAAGLTGTQQKEYENIARTNPKRADMYRDQCVAANSKGSDK